MPPSTRRQTQCMIPFFLVAVPWLVERFVNSLQAIDAYAHVENMI